MIKLDQKSKAIFKYETRINKAISSEDESCA